jgi:hypothetical protein
VVGSQGGGGALEFSAVRVNPALEFSAVRINPFLVIGQVFLTPVARADCNVAERKVEQLFALVALQ